ncbi:MAG: XF1762 family protein, partial [SAR324 cluster bacterium]|nr:XF1762 family protein [SAR324 cluster bacterium]
QMGGKRMITYTLQEESGSSLRGAGWKIVGEVKPTERGWDRSNRKRNWQPIYGQLKFRWEA